MKRSRDNYSCPDDVPLPLILQRWMHREQSWDDCSCAGEVLLSFFDHSH